MANKKVTIDDIERIVGNAIRKETIATVMPVRFVELIRTEAALASARHAGLKRAVMKDGEIMEAPLTPTPSDTSVTGLMFDTDKDAAGHPIRQYCILQDNMEYKVKIYTRHRPDGNAAWSGFELKGTMEMED